MVDLTARLNRLPPEQRTAILRHLQGTTDTLTRRKDTDPTPLSWQQEQMWMADRLGARNNIALVCVLQGPLDVEALRQAITTVITRHEILRTSYEETDGQPHPVLNPPKNAELPVRQRTTEQAQEACSTQAAQRLDLTSPDVVHLALYRTTPTEHRLLWLIHHLAWDPTSTAVLLDELAAAYQGKSLPKNKFRYEDYAAWQRDRLKGERGTSLADYWQQTLAGAAPCELPTDTRRDEVELGTGKAVSGKLLDLATAVRDTAEQHDATVYMTLLAAFAAVLHAETGLTDVVVGTASAGRPHPDLANVIGCFVNMVVVRLNVAGDPTFGELVTRARNSVRGALEHQELPFAQVVELCRPARTPGHHPLYGIEFTSYERRQAATRRLGDVELSLDQIPDGSAKSDLSFMVTETGDGLLVEVEYDAGLYREHTITDLIDRFGTVLAQAVGDTQTRLSDLTGPPRKVEADDPAPRQQQAVETELARRIADEIVAPTIGVPGIGAHDDVFGAGGNSRHVIQLVARTNAAYGVRLSLADLLAEPTAARLAALVEADRSADDDLDRVLDEVARMSDEDVERQLRA